MGEYLRNFVRRTQPLVGTDKLEAQFDKEFEERWADRSIPGWQEPTHKDKLFALPTSRLFNNESVLKSHQTGKQYKRKLEELQKLSIPEQKKIVTDSEDEDRRIARLESLAAKWRDFHSDVIS